MEGYETMTRFCKSILGIAAAAMLLIDTAARAMGSEARRRYRRSGSDTSGAGTLGLIDVQQSDLKQKTIKNNWVSYNGDYSGRRFSAMTQVTPANVSHLAAKWVFHTQQRGRAGSDSGGGGRSDVRYRLERCLCAGREDGQAAVAPCARRCRRG